MDDTLAPWLPWFDRMVGFVVRAKDEAVARALAAARPGDEGPDPWLSPLYSTCMERRVGGPEEVILKDSNPAK